MIRRPHANTRSLLQTIGISRKSQFPFLTPERKKQFTAAKQPCIHSPKHVISAPFPPLHRNLQFPIRYRMLQAVNFSSNMECSQKQFHATRTRHAPPLKIRFGWVFCVIIQIIQIFVNVKYFNLLFCI